jgi:dihydroorotase-like cyclic amidohydrolase
MGDLADVSAETCPHYLLCTEEDVARAGVFGKINPPVRHASDREALWQALGDGVIGHVATDHAGFTAAEKAASAQDFLAAPPGHPGFEALLPALLDAAAAGRLPLARVVDLVAAAPARRFGLADKGRIAEGAAADLALVDLHGETHITEDGLVTAARASARLYHGRRFRGRIVRTLVAGRTAHGGAVTARGRFRGPAAAEARQEEEPAE